MVICYQCHRMFGSASERDEHECPTVKAFKERPAADPGLCVIYNCSGFTEAAKSYR